MAGEGGEKGDEERGKILITVITVCSEERKTLNWEEKRWMEWRGERKDERTDTQKEIIASN